ncbi:MAG TPA: lipocalin family protein, partial [Salinimicrobium sp.]|nr:lipocalin family protein [Salinimicrobium sp.]
MRKLASLLLLCLFFMSCDLTSPEEKIANLNGYWEIQTAERPDGSIKEFRFSEMVDYIVVENNEGFRKKLRPQLGGTFIASDDKEKLQIKVENDSINLYYTTPYNTWKETLLSSDEEKLVLRNQHGIIYTYKRFTPYSSDYGQEK